MEVFNSRTREKFDALPAYSWLEKMKGLSGRKGGSMLFVFGRPCRPTFWMLGMKFRIDLVFLDENKVVKEIHRGLPPLDWETRNWKLYRPKAPARYALEVKQGCRLMAGDMLKWKD